jgi:hypothetical protein
VSSPRSVRAAVPRAVPAVIELERAHIWTVEEGKIRRIEECMDRDEALDAAGLRE